MFPCPWRAFGALLLVLTVGAAVRASDDSALSKRDALRFQSKVDQIQRNAAAPRRAGRPEVTQLTDVEVNAYFKYLAGSRIPTGIVDPRLSAQTGGHVAGQAMVDLDAVRLEKARTWTDPLSYLSGRLPISVSGTLTTRDGMGRFALDSAQISGVSIPKSLLQELLSHYSRTAADPAGINMDDPFPLPSGIREIRIEQGSAVVIQ
ncbi:MAG TPA: hypothetical protein VGL62_07965 [Vicinamibacterales bacterium]|jgi:hypothetical protein